MLCSVRKEGGDVGEEKSDENLKPQGFRRRDPVEMKEMYKYNRYGYRR